MKTKVKIINSTNQCNIKKGSIGYIDGYVKAADERPYAVVVCGHLIDLIPLYNLEVIT